jgi:DNA-binding NarL/FixJ family response regulator
MVQTIRVLVADDHAVVRAGLRDLLDHEPDITVIGEVRNGREALELALVQRPHVVLMDVSMPVLCGVEATRHIRGAAPEVRVLALTAHARPPTSTRCFERGQVAICSRRRLRWICGGRCGRPRPARR